MISSSTPSRLVYKAFMTILASMIFVFVFDMGAYFFRAVSLNQRMENLMVSMQRVVMENNYLPEGEYQLYETLFTQVADTMNSGGDTFINGFRINYNHASDNTLSALNAEKYNTTTGITQSTNVLRTRMDTPADYGDVMVVQTTVEVNQPTWRFVNGATRSADDWQNANTDSSIVPMTTRFTYTYYVPCLKYQSILN